MTVAKLFTTRFRITTALFFCASVSLLYLYGTVGLPRLLRNDPTPAAINMSYDGPFLAGNYKCGIPDIDPYDETILKYIKPAEPIICSSHDPLTYTSLEEGRQVLRIREDAVHHYDTSLEQLDCCYSVITRETETKNKESKCTAFKLRVQLAVEMETLYVECIDKNTSRELYKNMHAVIQSKSSKHQVPRHEAPPSNTDGINERLPNVLLLGIDSVSRLNLKRTMPRTVSFLQANSWVELRKYNKIGDNTVPNLMAILTGLDQKRLIGIKCWHNNTNTLDHCPFIWKEFKRKGYTTAYAEDEPHISTFNWDAHSTGFLHPPTDYYLRPFIVQAIKRLPIVKRDGDAICLGPTSTTDHYLKYTKDLLSTSNKSLVALIWLNNFSHENFNTPAAMDDRFFAFMQDVTTSGSLSNTIVVFFSDHGPRFNDIRLTYVGWLEERLPFIYIWVPEWFRKQYPDAYQNLVDNGDKLTSPYDLHLTLKDVVAGDVGKLGASSEGCPTCVSLFAPVSITRSCDDAGITPHWCTCAHQTQTPITDGVVQNATQFVIREMQQKLSHTKPAGDTKCALLKLNSVISARIKVDYNETRVYKDYVIVLETVPGFAIFDSTVRYWSNNVSSPYQIIGMISRITAYANQSQCMHDKELKLYCYCENIKK